MDDYSDVGLSRLRIYAVVRLASPGYYGVSKSFLEDREFALVALNRHKP
jgi:hypothetical protein